MVQAIDRSSEVIEAVLDKWFDEGYKAAKEYLASLYKNQFITQKVYYDLFNELNDWENTPDISIEELELLCR